MQLRKNQISQHAHPWKHTTMIIEEDNWSLESGSLQCQQLPVPPATLIFYKMIYILFFATLHNQISHLFPPCPTSLLPFLVSAAVIRLVRTLPGLIACSICTSWDVLSFRTKLYLCFFRWIIRRILCITVTS